MKDALCILLFALYTWAQPAAPQKKGPPQPPRVLPTAEETRQIEGKVNEIDAALHELRAKKTSQDLLADVEIYSHAGHLLLEFPDDFYTQDAIHHCMSVLDAGIERARQLKGDH